MMFSCRLSIKIICSCHAHVTLFFKFLYWRGYTIPVSLVSKNHLCFLNLLLSLHDLF